MMIQRCLVGRKNVHIDSGVFALPLFHRKNLIGGEAGNVTQWR
ncbi:MAG: hypothetical protein P8L85_14180 [Rubripirellula sp.]|nr:hypothetical protein [Rubripirellula sp.]